MIVVSLQITVEVCEGDQDVIIQLLRDARQTVEVVSLKPVADRRANGQYI